MWIVLIRVAQVERRANLSIYASNKAVKGKLGTHLQKKGYEIGQIAQFVVSSTYYLQCCCWEE